MTFPLFRILSCALLLSLTAPAFAHDTLILVSPLDKEASYGGRVLKLISSEAFRRLGLAVEVRHYPALRASVEVDAGNTDGEIGRSLEYGKLHPALVRVDEVMLSAKVAAYARTPGLVVDGWAGLKDQPYRVEYRAGYQLFRMRLEPLVPAERLSSVVNGQEGMRRLALGQTDVYIDTEQYGRHELERLRARFPDLHQAGVMEHTPVYFYLQPRHAALAPRLEAVLRQMRADGAMDRCIQQALKEDGAAAPPH